MPTEGTGWHSEGTDELSPVPTLARIQFCGIKHIVYIKYKISYGIFFFYIDKNIDGQNNFSTYLRREMLKNRNSQELKCGWSGLTKATQFQYLTIFFTSSCYVVKEPYPSY